ncbi:hypothetical protein K443DRAFT_498452 [Laccaria amethystina LaAM-08-1]|uniref:Unplaced genomic scaffold K443scaffold_5, whole genome shotgun sequence n=1 Tax=Laccaria amethystina LaAM-08-1 TaxID=1095629 RepID=A0A0C9YLU5_9AGAR|nr:hypothetical protein K443DRAFT_498452 [Laccaria amethystina LaAM-08-1]
MARLVAQSRVTLRRSSLRAAIALLASSSWRSTSALSSSASSSSWPSTTCFLAESCIRRISLPPISDLMASMRSSRAAPPSRKTFLVASLARHAACFSSVVR